MHACIEEDGEDIVNMHGKLKGYKSARFYHGIVLQQGSALNLKMHLIKNKAYLTVDMVRSYVFEVISILEELHKRNIAWMDIKPANFVFVVNEHNMQHLVAIDFDHARMLDEPLPQGYDTVTWEYASPEVANPYLPASGLSTPEQYDIWSVGITALEILDEGNSFCARLSGDVPAIKAKLKDLEDLHVEKHINARIMGNGFDKRAERAFFLSVLKVNPQDRPKASDLIPILRGANLGGFTALGKKVTDGFQRIDSSLTKMHDMLENIQKTLDQFQSEMVTSVRSITSVFAMDPAAIEDATSNLILMQKRMNKLHTGLDIATTAKSMRDMFSSEMRAIMQQYVSAALSESQATNEASIGAMLQQQNAKIEQQLQHFSSAISLSSECSREQLEDVKTTLLSRVGGLEDNLSLVLDELKDLKGLMRRLEEGNQSVRESMMRCMQEQRVQNAAQKASQKAMMDELLRVVDTITLTATDISDSAKAQYTSTTSAYMASANMHLQDEVQATLAELRRHQAAQAAQVQRSMQLSLQAGVTNAVAAALKQCQLSSSTSTSSASTTQKDSEEMKQELLALTKSIKGMRDDMHFIIEQTVSLSVDMAALQESVNKNANMLHTLLQGDFKVPMLLMVVPKELSCFGRIKALFSNKMLLYFVCPVSLERGLPYEFSMPRRWLVNALPAIKLSIVMLQVALAVVGLPIPALQQAIPGINMSNDTFEVMNDLTGKMEDEAKVSQNEECAQLIERVKKLPDDFANDSMEVLQKKVASLVKASNSSYQSIYDLLRDNLEKSSGGKSRSADWRPQLTGLEQVTSRKDSKTAWVLKDPTVMKRFHEKGAESLVF